MESGTPPPPRGGPDRRAAIGFGVVALVGIAIAAILLAGGGDGEAGGEEATANGCESVSEPAPKQVDLQRPDRRRPTASAVVFETSCGSFTVRLDAERAPRTAASFQHLAEQGVFDGTPFHRVVPGAVIQGGSPGGDSFGGPGYSIVERPPSDLAYTRGLVAMAKTAAEPPGTSGSQFFVVTAEADAGLPPEYALVGEVTEGFETVQAIEDLGAPGTDGPPSRPVVIESATVRG